MNRSDGGLDKINEQRAGQTPVPQNHGDDKARTTIYPLGQLDGEGVALVCVSYIDVGDAALRARIAIRRVQRQIPNVAILPNRDESGAIRNELKASYYAPIR